MAFCGLPGQGIHATRLFGFAFWDMFLTVVAAFLINKFVFKNHFWLTLAGLVTIGIVTHKAMGIDTKLNSMLFK